jgi:putative membrane protein
MTTHDTHHDHDHHNHRPDWKGWAQALILLGMAAILAELLITGQIANYINLSFAWLTVLATLIFAVLGGLRVLALTRGGQHDHADHDHAGHDHGALSWGAVAIVASPLFFAVFVPSTPLGVEAAGSVSTSLVAAASATVAEVPAAERNVLDWLRAINAQPTAAVFNGDPVNVTGFIYREPGWPADQVMIARFTISCCVADASALGLPVRLADGQVVEEGAWYAISGTMQAGEFRGETMPMIQPVTIEPVAIPQNPYLYS